MQDYGIYSENMEFYERASRQELSLKKESKNNSRELIEEYLELVQKIKEYETALEELTTKKTKLGKEIINTPELKVLIEELTFNNTHSKTK